MVTSTRAIWFAKAGDARGAEEDIRTSVEKGKVFIHFHHSAYNHRVCLRTPRSDSVGGSMAAYGGRDRLAVLPLLRE